MSLSLNSNISNALIAKFYDSQESTFLSQGDLISTETLRNNLNSIADEKVEESVYPYFFAKYKYSVIVNADCDIFREENGREPKIVCIQMAAVVPALPIISKIFQKLAPEGLSVSFVPEKRKNNLINAFEKLINQNEKLYFYLPANRNIGFEQAHIARLDTSVSFRVQSNEYYNAVLNSRIGLSVQEPFKSKLGENFAALFDRTGLPEVKTTVRDQYPTWLERELKSYFVILPDEVYRRSIRSLKAARKQYSDDNTYAIEAKKIIQETAGEVKQDIDTHPAMKELAKILENKCPRQSEVILSEIRSNAVINKYFEEATSTE